MNSIDQIRDNALNNSGGHQFTKEGLLLGIFKLTIQNNAMINTLIKMVSDVYVEMPPNPNMEAKLEAFREVKVEYENASKSLSKLFEQVSVQEAYDFAVEHDTTLDDDGGLTVNV